MAKAATATRSTTKAKEQALTKPPNDYVPRADLKVVNGIQQFYTITTDEQCARAVEVMQWIKDRIKSIKTNDKLQRLIKKTKDAYDEAKSIETDALKVYAPHEPIIRNEIARFSTARERARLAAQPKLTQRLTKQLVTAAQPLEIEAGDDVFEFEPVTPASSSVVTLQTADTGAGMRKFHHYALVDPEKPRTKDGDPIVNPEAGLRALCAAVAAGKVSTAWVMVNDTHAQARVNEAEANLDVPGLAYYFEMRPIIGGRR